MTSRRAAQSWAPADVMLEYTQPDEVTTQKETLVTATQKQSTWRVFGNLGKPTRLLSTLTIAVGLALVANALPPDALAQTAGARPNIVIIWGDDIGQSNISAYSNGLIG
jgi:hypothetical protein